MKKIGIVGGLAWPSTAEYYRLICSQANAHFKSRSISPPYPTPPIAIESLVMSETRRLRGKPGDGGESWAQYDAVFREAFKRLKNAGCDFGIIASNTPHTRLGAIRQGLDFPIISILEEAARVTSSIGAKKALVLGTSVTMKSDEYSSHLSAQGVEPNRKLPDEEVDNLQRIIDVEFYQGATDNGRDKLLEICKVNVTDAKNTAILLACTELPFAFPDRCDDIHFKAEGFQFVNTMAVHAHAALSEALELAN